MAIIPRPIPERTRLTICPVARANLIDQPADLDSMAACAAGANLVNSRHRCSSAVAAFYPTRLDGQQRASNLPTFERPYRASGSVHVFQHDQEPAEEPRDRRDPEEKLDIPRATHV